MYSRSLDLTVKALGSMAAELSWFLLRLIHSRFEMPLKLSAGMLLILLSAIQKGEIDQERIKPERF